MDASRLVEEGRVVDAATGEAFRWHPLPMVLVVSEALARWFEEERYEERRREALPTIRLSVA